MVIISRSLNLVYREVTQFTRYNTGILHANEKSMKNLTIPRCVNTLRPLSVYLMLQVCVQATWREEYESRSLLHWGPHAPRAPRWGHPSKVIRNWRLIIVIHGLKVPN